LTFYTTHGDWLGSACLFIAGMFVAASIGQRYIREKRREVWNS
jgi:hypothetical protein